MSKNKLFYLKKGGEGSDIYFSGDREGIIENNEMWSFREIINRRKYFVIPLKSYYFESTY